MLPDHGRKASQPWFARVMFGDPAKTCHEFGICQRRILRHQSASFRAKRPHSPLAALGFLVSRRRRCIGPKFDRTSENIPLVLRTRLKKRHFHRLSPTLTSLCTCSSACINSSLCGGGMNFVRSVCGFWRTLLRRITGRLLYPLTPEQLRTEEHNFTAAISRDAIRALASRYNDNLPCRLRDETSQGSFNVCFYADFFTVGTTWVVRVPIEPTVSHAWEKLQSEVYTMQYVLL